MVLIWVLLLWVMPKAQNCPIGHPITKIELAGLKHTREYTVRRELRHLPGAVYADSSGQQELRALQGLELFAAIERECRVQDSTMVLRYTFTELFQYLPLPAVSRTDQDGWMVGGAIVALNLGGRDIWMEIQGRTGVDPLARSKSLALYTRSPWLGEWPLNWKVDLVRTHSWDALRNYQENSWEGATEGLWGQQRLRPLLALGVRLEPDFSLPNAGVGAVWETRDAPSSPRRGVYGEVRVSQWGGLSATPSYQEYLFDLRTYAQPSRSHGIVVHHLVRWRPGTIPLSGRLQQGGTNSLRGWAPDSLLHGQHEWLMTAEWRGDLIHRRALVLGGQNAYWGLQAVGGMDGAFLWNQGQPQQVDFRTAAYSGVHLLVPALERVRCELGFRPDGSWHVTVGLFEKAVAQRWRNR